uniref:Uncharacterized protein n=1 Tax=Rhizophora mucronata TaxID=61149 RepID=A0A2P2IN37_RHIMU
MAMTLEVLTMIYIRRLMLLTQVLLLRPTGEGLHVRYLKKKKIHLWR